MNESHSHIGKAQENTSFTIFLIKVSKIIKASLWYGRWRSCFPTLGREKASALGRAEGGPWGAAMRFVWMWGMFTQLCSLCDNSLNWILVISVHMVYSSLKKQKRCLWKWAANENLRPLVARVISSVLFQKARYLYQAGNPAAPKSLLLLNSSLQVCLCFPHAEFYLSCGAEGRRDGVNRKQQDLHRIAVRVSLIVETPHVTGLVLGL